MNLISTSADVPQKQIAPRPIPCFPKEAPLSPGGASAFPVFPVETRAPVIVQERARGFWKFCASRTAYFQPDAMRCSGRWMIMLLTATCQRSFPKGNINARQQAPKKCPANYPDRRLSTHGRIRMGRFFVFIIIVSIALVLGMAFLVTHGSCSDAPARTTAEGAFIHGGLAAWSRHLSSRGVPALPAFERSAVEPRRYSFRLSAIAVRSDPILRSGSEVRPV